MSWIDTVVGAVLPPPAATPPAPPADAPAVPDLAPPRDPKALSWAPALLLLGGAGVLALVVYLAARR